jgi:hypothetical protein
MEDVGYVLLMVGFVVLAVLFTIEDTPGGGATFVLSLPRTDSVDKRKEGQP